MTNLKKIMSNNYIATKKCNLCKKFFKNYFFISKDYYAFNVFHQRYFIFCMDCIKKLKKDDWDDIFDDIGYKTYLFKKCYVCKNKDKEFLKFNSSNPFCPKFICLNCLYNYFKTIQL